MRSMICCAFVSAILVATSGFAADEVYKLPKDKKAAVITLDHKGGFTPRRVSDAPVLSILADGTIKMPDRFGFSKDVNGKMSQKELQALLRFIIKENKFFEYDKAKVAAKMKKAAAGRNIPRVADASTLVIEVKIAEKSNKASQYALGLMANQYKTVAEIQQLSAINRRLNRLMNTVRLGGEKELKKNLALVNAELKKKFPKAKALTKHEFQSCYIRKDGSKTVSFNRLGRTADGKYDRTYVRATIQYPAKGEPKIFVAAKLK